MQSDRIPVVASVTIQLRGPWGEAHGDCGRCGIYHAIQKGEQTDEQIEKCKTCYLAGRTLDPTPFLRARSVLEGLAADSRRVALVGGSSLPAQEALELFDADPGAFKLAPTITMQATSS